MPPEIAEAMAEGVHSILYRSRLLGLAGERNKKVYKKRERN